MHDALLEHQPEWGESPNPQPIIVNLASRVGLDVNRFTESLHSPAIQNKILQDVTAGQDLNISGTPTFFINGQQVHPKLSMEDLVQLIDAHLHK
jgi:protein-disulfide isomerase